jgi:hypothetical protein
MYNFSPYMHPSQLNSMHPQDKFYALKANAPLDFALSFATTASGHSGTAGHLRLYIAAAAPAAHICKIDAHGTARHSAFVAFVGPALLSNARDATTGKVASTGMIGFDRADVGWGVATGEQQLAQSGYAWGRYVLSPA